MALLPDTSVRVRESEWMDDPSLERAAHRRALSGLARINALSRSARSIWSALRRRLPERSAGPLRVLDVACGGGDVATAIARLARRDGYELRVDGCDASPTAVELARRAADGRGREMTVYRLDALRDPLPGGYDATTSNLFLHHLADDEAVHLLERLSAAAPALVVSDLARHGMGYAAAVAGTRLLTRSPVVHADGPRSVRAAFTPGEARTLARRAGLDGARVVAAFPWRWRLDWGPV